MAVKINSISFTNEFRAETTDYLLGAIGDKIIATIDFQAEWFLEMDVSKNLYTNLNEMWWVAAGGGVNDYSGDSWTAEGFRVGDVVDIYFAPTHYIRNITAISSDGLTITVDGAAFGVGVVTAFSAVSIDGRTECTGINFKANTIENEDSVNYNSLIDGNENKFSKAGIDYTNVLITVDLIQQGLFKSNNQGSAYILGYGTLNRFVLTHTFYITPLFLVDQLNTLGLIIPDYYEDKNCLRYIYNIELLYTLNDPNRKHVTEDDFLIGNTGWFNENFNKGKNYFTISPPIFTVAGLPKTYVDFSQETGFAIVISAAAPAFSNNNTKFVLNHFFLPESDTEYINTSTDVATNFMFDRALQTVGAVAVNGDGYATGKQVFKQIQALFISSTTILITGKIDLSAAYKTRIEAATNKQLALFVTIQNHALATEDADKVALFYGLNVYDQDLTNPDAGNVVTEFISHPETTVAGASEAYSGSFVEDWQIGKSNFSIDITNGAVLKNVAVKIIASHATYGNFNLETKNFSTVSASVVAGVQEVNIVEAQGFKMGAGNIFDVISLLRDSASDSGNNKFYELLYPFKIRWEDFVALANVSSQFFDATLPNNGFNQDWARYYAASGWSIIYRTQLTIEENGVNNIIQSDSNVLAWDYSDATDWSGVIQSYDYATSVVITGNVLLDAKTTIKAIFTKTSGSPPIIGDIAGVMGVAPKGAGGVKIIREISTVHVHESDSPWISVLGNSLLKKSMLVNVYTFEAVIDNAKLVALFPGVTQFDFSGRIYELPIPSLASKQFEDNDAFAFEDDVVYEFE